jgi:DNA-directed RNA polymerase I, II, and III subunit RPABC2
MSKKKSSYSYFDEEDYDENSNDEKSSIDDTDEDEEEEEVEVGVNQEDEEENDEDELSEEENISDEDEEQIGGAEDIDVDEIQIDNDGNEVKSESKKTKKMIINNTYIKTNDDTDNEDDNDEDDGELYLKKFDKEINDNYIVNFHPECALQNYDEIFAMTKVVRDEHGIIIDDLHRTIPYLTKYEKARILGQRAKQINSGATPFVKVPENVIDGYLIAELELQQKRIPFIIRRPLPNGGSEYWNLKDLENISF